MISNTYANKILDLACGVEDNLTMPSYLYLGLCSNEPTSTGTVTGEPTAASYDRVVVGGKSANDKYFGFASGGIISNDKEIHFNTAKENFGTMHYFFLSESETGPAILWGKINGDNGVDINVTNGEVVPVFFKEDLKASIDVALT